VTPSDTVETAAEVVAAFVANNSLPVGELPVLIQTVHAALTKLKEGVETPAAEEPKAPRSQSVGRSRPSI
jgi:predicted transcriptional regulator